MQELLKQILGKVDQIGSDVSTLKTDVSTLKTDVSTLKTDVSVLKEGQQRLEGRMEDFEQGQIRIETRMEDLDQGQICIETRMENVVIDKIRALFDAREVQNDSIADIREVLGRVEAKVDVLQLETSSLRKLKKGAGQVSQVPLPAPGR
ncbi:MAG: hypothetical protein VB144_06840 [Clostridia bacterium]|nr:hypothetical protein [Clostridia bacterium]